jgi:hypothetical protein
MAAVGMTVTIYSQHRSRGKVQILFTGESVLRCTHSTPPTAAEIVNLLNHSGGSQQQLPAWAKTPVGEALSRTTFVVTERYDNPR